MRRQYSADLALLATVIIWSLNISAVKVGVGAIAPLAFSVARFGLGATVTMVVALAIEGRPHFERRDLGLLFAAALCGITVNQVTFVEALHFASASNVALLIGTIPICTAVAAIFFRQERLDLGHWIAIAAGFAGVTLIIVGGGPSGNGGTTLLGEGLALATAASWGIYTVGIRPLMARYSALQLSAFMMVVGTVALVPFAAPEIASQDWGSVPTEAWLALVYAALFSVSLTNILWFTAVHWVGASRAAVYTYLEPFLGALLAVILLSEHIELIQLAGGAVIIGAVAFVRLRRAAVVPAAT